MVNFKGRKISMDEIDKSEEEGGLSNGYYFIRKKSHTMISGPRFKKPKLREAIEERGWIDGDVVIEEGNMPFLYLYTKK